MFLKTFHLILKRYLYRINRKNGAGKSTLIDILIGNVNANSGEIFDKDKLLQSENRYNVPKTMFPDQLKVIEIINLYQSFP